MNDTTVEEIQVDIDEAKATIEMMDSLNRLGKNKDFEKIINDGYFKEEAYRLVHLKAAPAMQAPERQEALLKAIDAIGALQQHFHMIYVMGQQAQDALQQADIALEEMAMEGGI
jgi:hypothetical protein|tara:strand:- start:679 stop:1020 length:342 start_codon:yes stop_codon:yes gene_type:complete